VNGLRSAFCKGKWWASDGKASPAGGPNEDKDCATSVAMDLMAVEVKTSPRAFEAGIPRMLFEARLESTRGRSRYQVADNGQVFAEYAARIILAGDPDGELGANTRP
jgi:hypothetical protein